MLSSSLQRMYRLSEYILKPGAREAMDILRATDKLSRIELIQRRNIAFQRLITHCYDTVPYYKETMMTNRLKPQDFKTVDDIKKLPILTKEVIREQKDRLVSSAFIKSELFKSRSGGTTGEPIESLLNPRQYYIEHYAYWRGLEWMGWNPNLGIIKLFGGSLGTLDTQTFTSRLKDRIFKTKFLPAFEISPERRDYYFNEIIAHGKSVIIGYASALYNLAKEFKSISDEKLKDLKIEQVFFTAEYMDPSWAAQIKEVFNCPVKGFYGCGEINSLGFQIDHLGAYRIPTDHVEIESIYHEGISNCLAITPLFNYAKPLLRYVNGDLGIVRAANEKEKYNVISSLEGRTADMLISEFGNHISPSIAPHTVLITKVPVTRYQVIQRSVRDLEFRYEVAEGVLSSEDQKRISEIFKKHLGPNLHMEFIQTSDFELSTKGKHRIVISKVSMVEAKV